MSEAKIDGLTCTASPCTFDLSAKTGTIVAGDGNSIFMWGYGNGNSPMQYTGPTLIVPQNAVVTVNLTNRLSVPTSIVFPGQSGVTAVGGIPGSLTSEAAPSGGAVTYTFTASRPGTFMYHSGTKPDIQVEMGLIGALIVRPVDALGAVIPNQAYASPDSAYNYEYLFLLTDMDIRIHDLLAVGKLDQVDTAAFFPVYWFINGRTLPDTLAATNAVYLPNQPYNALPRIRPGDRALYRIIGGGRDGHPHHAHGNHHFIIARDAMPLESVPGSGVIDMAQPVFTTAIQPGETADAIMEWTGANMGWDIYGHAADVDNIPVNTFPGPGDTDWNGNGIIDAGDTDNPPLGFSTGEPPGVEDVDLNGNGLFDLADIDVTPANTFPGIEDIDWNGNGIVDPCPAAVPGEDALSHCIPFPVDLPAQQALTFGQFYSGSPFLGASGNLPPGQGGFNANGGYFFMYHSHSEKELTNNDIFPGGLATFTIVEPPTVTDIE
jgi:hypothetical protein